MCQIIGHTSRKLDHMSRIRTKNTVSIVAPALAPGTYHAYLSYCNGGGENVAGSVQSQPAFAASGVESRLEDSTGKTVPHGCFHRKRIYDFKTGDGPYVIPNLGPNGWLTYQGGPEILNKYREHIVNSAGYMNWDLSSKTSNPPRWTVSFDNINEVAMKNDVLEKAKRLKADILLDLVEGNQVMPAFRGLAECIPEMARNWKSIRKVITTASSGYLAWKFGVKPLVSDIQALMRSVPKLGSEVEALGNNRLRFSKFASGLVSPVTTLDVVYAYNNINLYERQWTMNLRKPPVIRYVLVVEPNVEYTLKAFKALDYTLRRFTTSPASLLWEKIPYSFVVDWFVDVRGVLRGLDDALGVSPYKIIAFTKSKSYRVETAGNWVFRSPCVVGAPALNRIDIGSCEYSHYERSVVSPGANAPTWKPRFGKNQAGITAALIGQQLGKISRF